MIRCKALAMFILAAGTLPSGIVEARHEQQKPRTASGLLHAFWEYPAFLPDEPAGHSGMPFSIKEKRWRKAYLAPILKAQVSRPSDTICFRIVGQGFIVLRAPIDLWPAREEFVFTKVSKLEALASDAECEARLRREGN
jgi:hypothetical protein